MRGPGDARCDKLWPSAHTCSSSPIAGRGPERKPSPSQLRGHLDIQLALLRSSALFTSTSNTSLRATPVSCRLPTQHPFPLSVCSFSVSCSFCLPDTYIRILRAPPSTWTRSTRPPTTACRARPQATTSPTTALASTRPSSSQHLSLTISRCRPPRPMARALLGRPPLSLLKSPGLDQEAGC